MDHLANFDPKDPAALEAVKAYALDGGDHEWGWYVDHVPALVDEIERLRDECAHYRRAAYILGWDVSDE